LIEKDLWIDERRGVILDAQVLPQSLFTRLAKTDHILHQRTFYLRKERPDRAIDLKGNILRRVTFYLRSISYCPRYCSRPFGNVAPMTHPFVSYSPGYIDLQLNGGYGFDFSVYDDEKSYKRGMQLVAERIVETGVTSYVRLAPCFMAHT
jgi:N-acetylglucosamine-6-phosphate deacetylase